MRDLVRFLRRARRQRQFDRMALEQQLVLMGVANGHWKTQQRRTEGAPR